MRKCFLFLGIICSGLLTNGCTINLPFQNRLSYHYVQAAKAMNEGKTEPINLKWLPPDFPERIDTQGASGFVGGGSRTRIPIGIGIANRITEILDVMRGIDPKSDKTLVIKVIEAKSEFEYSAGLLNLTPGMDVGRCFLEAEFTYPGKAWKDKFSAEVKDTTVGASTQVGVLEKAWDEIALKVGKSVKDNI